MWNERLYPKFSDYAVRFIKPAEPEVLLAGFTMPLPSIVVEALAGALANMDKS